MMEGSQFRAGGSRHADNKSMASSIRKSQIDSPTRSISKRPGLTDKDSQADTMSVATFNTAASPKKGTISELLVPNTSYRNLVPAKTLVAQTGTGQLNNRDLAKLSKGGSIAGGSIAPKSMTGTSFKSAGTARSRRTKAESEIDYENMDGERLDIYIAGCKK